jgi:hypothetical protein
MMRPFRCDIPDMHLLALEKFREGANYSSGRAAAAARGGAKATALTENTR